METKYVVVTWPDSQLLMEHRGFSKNCFLINDENGLETFGSSAYFVDENWLAKVTGEKASKRERKDEREEFCEQTYFLVKDTEDADEKFEFMNPFNLADGKVVVGFYLDEDEETIRVLVVADGYTALKHLSQMEKDGDVIEELDFFELSIKDRYEVAQYIDAFDYEYYE